MDPQRKSAINKALTHLIPGVSFSDAEKIRKMALSPHMNSLHPSAAIRLAAIAYIRHCYTDYDELMDTGYDHDAARFFVAPIIQEKLVEWRANFNLQIEE